MDESIILKTRVSMSFEHDRGVAAIGKGSPVTVIDKDYDNKQYLVDYGKHVLKWESKDFLENYFDVHLNEPLLKIPLNELIRKQYRFSVDLQPHIYWTKKDLTL